MYFPSFPEVKPLFHVLSGIFDISPGGFTTAVLSYLGGEGKQEVQLKALSNRAEALYVFNKNAVPHINGMIEMVVLCFGPRVISRSVLILLRKTDRRIGSM